MKYICLTFLILLFCQSAFSQSKKEQIEILIFQKDSLGKVLSKERQLNTDQVKQLETKITKINSDMGLIQKEFTQIKMDFEKVNSANKKTIENLELKKMHLENKLDSLYFDNFKLEQNLSQSKALNYLIEKYPNFNFLTYELCEAEFENKCNWAAFIQLKKGDKIGLGNYVKVYYSEFGSSDMTYFFQVEGYVLKHKNGITYILKNKKDIFNDEIGIQNGNFVIDIANSRLIMF